MVGKQKFKQFVYTTGTITGMPIVPVPPPNGINYYFYIKRNENKTYYYYSDDGTWASEPLLAKEFTDEQEAQKIANKLSKEYPGAKPFSTTQSLHTPSCYYYITVMHDNKVHYYCNDGNYLWTPKPQEAKEFTNETEAKTIANDLRKQYCDAEVSRQGKSLKGN